MQRLSNAGLYSYLQQVQGYLAPSITAVFLLGLFYPRTNSPGAVSGLVIGFLLGMGKLTVQLFHATPEGEEPSNTLLNYIADFNFLYASGVLFAATVILVVLVSKVTPPPNEEQLKGLTWQSIDKKVRESWSMVDLVTTAIVLICVVGIYGYFSFWI